MRNTARRKPSHDAMLDIDQRQRVRVTNSALRVSNIMKVRARESTDLKCLAQRVVWRGLRS